MRRLARILLMLGEVGFLGRTALQSMLAHHLNPVFNGMVLAGTILLALAWVLPHRIGSFMFGGGWGLFFVGFFATWRAHLYGEALVATTACFTLMAIVALLRLIWWPTRYLSPEARDAYLHRQLERLRASHTR
jgi:hypothetical protein